MNFIPTKSALIHLRLPFSVFLLPIFLFALSQTPNFNLTDIVLVFLCWHFFIYPASNGFNSYFDKDEQSIALIKSPPKVDKSLYYLSLFLQLAGFVLGCMVSLSFGLATLIYSLISDAYSHPAIRLKKYPILSFLVVFIFQGAFVYWSTYVALSGIDLYYAFGSKFFIAGLISSFLVGASYPITQIYQFKEDSLRGDKTLAMKLGYRGSFIFSGLLFLIGTTLIYFFWQNVDLRKFNYWLVYSTPTVLIFLAFTVAVWKNNQVANYKNVMRFVWFSSITMLLYFGWLVLERLP